MKKSLRNSMYYKYFFLALLIGTTPLACSKNDSKDLAGPSAKKSSSPDLNRQSSDQELTDSISALQLAVKTTPSFENYTELGLEQMRKPDYEEALKAFRKSVKINSSSGLAFNNICAALNALKRYGESINMCARAVELSPDFALAKNNFEFSKTALKSAKERVAHLQERVKTDNPNDAALIDLGLEQYNLGEYSDAMATWIQIPTTSSFWARAQNNIGSAAIMSEKWQFAGEKIQMALSREPENQLFKNNLNWLSQAKKESEE